MLTEITEFKHFVINMCFQASFEKYPGKKNILNKNGI